MHWFKLFKNLKTSKKTKTGFNLETFIEYAPPEIFEQLFDKLPIRDVLKCRSVCKRIRSKIDLHYSTKLQVVLEDRKWNKRLSHPMTIFLDTLHINNFVHTTMTQRFVQASFIHVKTIHIHGAITTKAFRLLTQEVPTLVNLKLHSLTLGGPLNFHEINGKAKVKNINSPIRKLDLHLDYIPMGTKGFSSLRLIRNLRELKNWNLKLLQSISFTVELSTFNEQFYFGFHTFLASIPTSSYQSLHNLKISCPKLKPENPHTLELVKSIFTQIQFKNLELRFQNVKHACKPDLQASRDIVVRLAKDLGLNAQVIVNQ